MTRRARTSVETSQLVLDGLRRCESCGAYAGFECAHDRAREDVDYGAKHKRRPRGCLNVYDPATSEWPEGF